MMWNSNLSSTIFYFRSPKWLSGKEYTCQCRRHGGCGFNPWVRKIPWRRAWPLTPAFLPGGSHRQRGLAVYSLWGPKSQTQLKWLSTHTQGLELLSQREKMCPCFSDLQSFTAIPIPNSVKTWTIWALFSCPKCIFKNENKWQYSEGVHELMKLNNFRSGWFFVALILQVWFEGGHHQPDLGSG